MPDIRKRHPDQHPVQVRITLGGGGPDGILIRMIRTCMKTLKIKKRLPPFCPLPSALLLPDLPMY